MRRGSFGVGLGLGRLFKIQVDQKVFGKVYAQGGVGTLGVPELAGRCSTLRWRSSIAKRRANGTHPRIASGLEGNGE